MRDTEQLAIHGGAPVRARPMPARRLFGAAELEKVRAVFEHAWATGVDFGYQGPFEAEYTQAVVQWLGCGFADAVSSGTAALFLAAAALELPAESEVICSPVTDPGGLTPLVALGLKPVLADSTPGSWRLAAAEVAAHVTARTRAVVVTHVGGIPCDMDALLAVARTHDLRVIEDCAQAHGARYRGRLVGTFGDCAVFSTMFSKHHATGGCGGLIYTQDVQLYDRVRAGADRGKPFHAADFAPKDPTTFLRSAMNFNQDEISCAIGTSTLARLPGIVAVRRALVNRMADGLRAAHSVYLPPLPPEVAPAYFFVTLGLRMERLTVDKRTFAEAVAAEGIPLNPDYRYVASEWPWLRPHLGAVTTTPNASAWRETSFNVLLHEGYTAADVDDIVAALLKVERALLRKDA